MSTSSTPIPYSVDMTYSTTVDQHCPKCNEPFNQRVPIPSENAQVTLTLIKDTDYSVEKYPNDRAFICDCFSCGAPWIVVVSNA